MHAWMHGFPARTAALRPVHWLQGLALEASALGVAGGRSPFIASKGAAVDVKIVEVALFFQNEIIRCVAPRCCCRRCRPPMCKPA